MQSRRSRPGQAPRWIRGTIAAAALAGAILCALATVAAPAEAAPPAGQIAFVRAGDIWIMDTDGANERQLTSTSATDRQPAWAPNGQKIAFLRGAKQLWVMNADGSGALRIPFPLGLRQMPGTAHKRVTYSIAAIAWSPDGAKLAVAGHAYSCYPDTAGGINETQLFTVRPNGSAQRRIGALIGGWPERLSWRPTGGSVLLTQYYRMGYSSVKTFNLKTRRYSSTFSKSAVLSKAVWSPDGKRIAAERPDEQVYVQGPACLCSYDARTHARTTVLAVDRGYDWTYISAAWSPDGQWLACATGDHWDPSTYGPATHDIEIVPAAGGDSTFIMGDADEPAWRPQ